MKPPAQRVGRAASCPSVTALLTVLDSRTSAGPVPVASDNASASQSGPGENQQAAHREPLKLHQEAAEDDVHTDGFSGHLREQPTGPAVHPELLGAMLISRRK